VPEDHDGFALENRVRPDHKYLRWELREHPFSSSPWSQVPLVDLRG
jgi:hypothetical protein